MALASEVIERFFTVLESPQTRFPRILPVSPRSPPEHIDGPTNADGWAEWKVIRNQRPHDYSKLEARLPASLPPSYKRWHSAAYTLDLDLGLFRLYAVPFGKPFEELEAMIPHCSGYENSPFSLGLIPIGYEGNDAGELCFDSTAARPDGEWPVTYWDHDWMKKGPILASSFTALLGLAVKLIEPGDKRADRTQARIKLLQGFVNEDPSGAGSPEGLEYWSRWAGGPLKPPT